MLPAIYIYIKCYTIIACDEVKCMPITWPKYDGKPEQFESYILEYRLQVPGPTEQENQIITKETINEVASNYYEIKGLEGGTSYQVCISVKTIDFGQSPRSEWKKFETKSKIESDKDLLTNKIEAVVSNLAKSYNNNVDKSC